MDQTVLITGASSGIGTATALELGREYKKIALMGFHHQDELNRLASTLADMQVECICACGDLADYAFVDSFVTQVLQAWGHIDILINNAGISYIGLLTDMSIEDWHRVMDSNVTSVFNTCRCVVPHMVHAKAGRILNVSSMWGIAGASCEVAYSASKGAINAFTKALGKELAPSNISVNAVAFGVIDTPMNACFSEEERAVLCEEIPAGRMADAGEAAVMLHNLLRTPSYMTSQIIGFDGGYL